MKPFTMQSLDILWDTTFILANTTE